MTTYSRLLSLRRLFVAAFFVCAAALLSACHRGGETGLYPGDIAPDVALTPLSGEGALKLSDLRGKVVLVNFWASWCGACVSELPAMERLFARLKDRGFVILAIGVDDEAGALGEFQRKYGLTFPIVVDREGAAKERYKIGGVPESFIVDREGKLVMFPDPEDGIPAVRVVGPRQWDSPDSVARFEAVLQ